jgi:hypothetical protein
MQVCLTLHSRGWEGAAADVCTTGGRHIANKDLVHNARVLAVQTSMQRVYRCHACDVQVLRGRGVCCGVCTLRVRLAVLAVRPLPACSQ